MSSGAVSSLRCLFRSPSFLLRWSCFFRDPGPTRESCFPSWPSLLLRWRCLPRRSCLLSRRGFPLRWLAGTLRAWHRASLIGWCFDTLLMVGRFAQRKCCTVNPFSASTELRPSARTLDLTSPPPFHFERSVLWPPGGDCSTAATILYINAFRHSSVADVAVIFAVAPFLTAALGWLWLKGTLGDARGQSGFTVRRHHHGRWCRG
jgi:drug/metabolite transporter (DMT)-like permease